MFCLPVSSMLSCALPRPAGGDAGPLVKYPWPLAPSLKKNHPISALTGVFGVTTNVHPNATTTSATKMPRNPHLPAMLAPPRSLGQPLAHLPAVLPPIVAGNKSAARTRDGGPSGESLAGGARDGRVRSQLS